jgi:hypothetical protein
MACLAQQSLGGSAPWRSQQGGWRPLPQNRAPQGLYGHSSEGGPYRPTCGVRRCGFGHYVPTSFGSPAAIAFRP